MNKRDEAVQRYIKENIRQIMVKVNKKTEADLYEWIEQIPNKQGYIKDLIRADMERNSK